MKSNIFFLLPIFILLFFIFGWASQKPNNSSSPDSGEQKAAEYYFKNIQVIDHWNLRYFKRYDTFSLKEQVSQIKANMDVAAELEFTSYLLLRFKAIADAGITSVGVRFNWNSGRFLIIDKNRPWANWINIYTFHRFAQNPYANPDDILMDFCKAHFPEAPNAAFNMYKNTFDFIKAVYYNNEEKYLNSIHLKI